MKHYLVIQLARFGDLIQTKRLLATLLAREGAVVHLCVDRSLEALARLVYPQVIVHPLAAHGTGLKGNEAVRTILKDNAHIFQELQTQQYESVFNLNFSPLNFRLAALFDPTIVEGYAWLNGQEITGLWPAMAMRWSDFRRLSINLVDFWAGYCADMIAPEAVNPVATPKGDGIGVVLAGRESRRSLPAELLARILTTMAGSTKTPTIKLLGGKSEFAAGQKVFKELPPRLQDITTNLAGKTAWTDLVDIVGSLDVLLTPDTGTMHLAAHLGTPVRAFFLSSAWCFETGPYGEGHTVYQAFTQCLPCLETQPCPYDVMCLSCFNSPEFQRFIATEKADHAPEGLIAFHSSFDDLGQIYTPFAGEDSDIEQRTAFRQFIHQYLTGIDSPQSLLTSNFAERLYRDKDWTTLPGPGETLGL